MLWQLTFIGWGHSNGNAFYVIGSLMAAGHMIIAMLSNSSMHEITAAIFFGSGIINMALAVIIHRLESR